MEPDWRVTEKHFAVDSEICEKYSSNEKPPNYQEVF